MSINQISKERWDEAQKEELHDHITGTYDLSYYESIYKIIFSLLGLKENDFNTKIIVEVGPALYPCLLGKQTKSSIVVEPLFNNFPSHIKDLYYKNNIKVYSELFEEIDIEKIKCDEVWIFNTMQHILNPDLFIENLIKSSKIIRILEPINWPTNNAHPHTYTFEYFSSKFEKYENNLKVYKGNSIVNFHSSDCVYGTINIQKVL